VYACARPCVLALCTLVCVSVCALGDVVGVANTVA